MILEGPGSIFRGFGRRKRCLKAFLGGKHFATDLSCIIGPFAGEKWPRSCRATGHLPRMPVLPCPGSDGRGAHGVGGRRCPPPQGAFNPPATEGVPTACQTDVKLALSNHSWPISTFFRAVRPEVFFPLSFPFPTGLGITGAQLQICAFCVLLGHLGRFFRLPNRA